jgi:hypothetical protein
MLVMLSGMEVRAVQGSPGVPGCGNGFGESQVY